MFVIIEISCVPTLCTSYCSYHPTSPLSRGAVNLPRAQLAIAGHVDCPSKLSQAPISRPLHASPSINTKDHNTHRSIDHISDRMFKKEITTAPKSKLKSSVQRGLRQSLLATYPLLNPYIDEILPKKGSLEAMKLPDRCTLYVLDAQPLFFQHDVSATLLPHLRLVHRFPAAFPSIRIDRGAIRFVLSGATLMAPGLTSTGGRLPSGTGSIEDQGLDDDDRWTRELEKGEPVVVRAEGKIEACAVGFLVMGTKEVKEKGKGPVIEDAHYLGDGLWKLTTD
ncbi:hypothetical protein F4818DRAFT_417293 [Hypoxylon cercidicola]|nr:hypothetical protein F4818DRAFT_417293 [Hypoxylon cercidicola]